MRNGKRFGDISFKEGVGMLLFIILLFLIMLLPFLGIIIMAKVIDSLIFDGFIGDNESAYIIGYFFGALNIFIILILLSKVYDMWVKYVN